ncbi:serine hydrolase domain-containing protein [Sphingomicrobium nitratireducens]|uniref:serine hydrolase domain-containing protein n=1 Tax=Sphingomicrobium nitratireducens TaxID=2964666 RepID=UPI00223EA217|nr:serine hydrolase domain-containing protein [Sphingomicrobium nitratireducens]
MDGKLAMMVAALAVTGCAPRPMASVGDAVVAPAGLADVDPARRAAVEALLEKHGVPGLQLVDLEACRPVAALEAGTAIVENATPVARDTLFEAASLSKTVFAYLVMTLVDDGVIDLDRPLATDGFAYPRIVDQQSYAKLTPRLLLSHRSGLPNWAGNPLTAGAAPPIEFEEPVGTYVYSGEGIQLLQAYVEWKTGRTLPDLFGALLGADMPHSQFAGPVPPGARASRGYGNGSSRPLMQVEGNGVAAASLLTTAEDFSHFVSRVCRGEGLSTAAHAEMLSVQSDWYEDVGLPTARLIGWSTVRLGGRDLVAHTGNNGQYRSLAMFDPQTGDGMVVTTNGENGTDLILDLLGLGESAR